MIVATQVRAIKQPLITICGVSGSTGFLNMENICPTPLGIPTISAPLDPIKIKYSRLKNQLAICLKISLSLFVPKNTNLKSL